MRENHTHITFISGSSKTHPTSTSLLNSTVYLPLIYPLADLVGAKVSECWLKDLKPSTSFLFPVYGFFSLFSKHFSTPIPHL